MDYWTEYCSSRVLHPSLVTLCSHKSGRCTPLPWLPVLSKFEPPALRRKAATDKLVEKIVKHDSWPIQPDIFNAPLLRLTSRKLLWLDLQPVDIKSRCRHNWNSAQLVNSHLVCDPTIRQPGFDLARQQWSLLNRFRTEQGHCNACWRKWRLTGTDLCACGETQTMFHIVESLFCGWPVMVHDMHTTRRRRSKDSDRPLTFHADTPTSVSSASTAGKHRANSSRKSCVAITSSSSTITYFYTHKHANILLHIQKHIHTSTRIFYLMSHHLMIRWHVYIVTAKLSQVQAWMFSQITRDFSNTFKHPQVFFQPTPLQLLPCTYILLNIYVLSMISMAKFTRFQILHLFQALSSKSSHCGQSILSRCLQV